MTQAELFNALEAHLQRHAVPFSRGDLIAFVEACGPVEEAPDIDRWCQEFLASQLRETVEWIGVVPAGSVRVDERESA